MLERPQFFSISNVRPQRILKALATGAACACILGLPEHARPCCAVAPLDTPVRFTHQVNLIIWDEAEHIEHFVRNASFATTAADLAFIAPTPSVPELGAFGKGIFDVLHSAMEYASHPPLVQPMECMAGGEDDAAGVAVEQVKDVAGYHVVTLKATGAKALESWLKANGFPVTPAVTQWAAFYVSKGWHFTTFKVVVRTVAETGLVRMSFRTEKPFNPYYVPRSNQPERTEKQGLDLYFVSEHEYSGKIGGTEDWIEPEISFGSGRVGSATTQALSDAYGTYTPGGSVVTYFRDPSFPRVNADDIYFERTPESKRWRVPEYKRIAFGIASVTLTLWPCTTPIFLIVLWRVAVKVTRARRARIAD